MQVLRNTMQLSTLQAVLCILYFLRERVGKSEANQHLNGLKYD